MKKFKLVACAAAAAAMFATNAFAAADMDSSADSSGGGTYVGESTIDATNGTLLNTGAAALQEAVVTLGASFATNAVAYVRFDLPAGVTFSGNPTFAINDSNAAAAGVSVAQGGAGESYVIFAVAPSAGTENLVGSEQGTFAGAAAGGITVKNKNAVSLTYKLFETLTNAANNTLPLKTASEATFISFANAVSFGATTAQSAVADVSATGGAYTAFTGAAAEKAVATLNVTHTARALVASGAATTSVDDVLVDTNSIVVSGDFTAAVANGVDLRVTNCAGANAAGVTTVIAADKLSVTFSTITAAVIEQVLAVCYETNGTTPIVASTYSGTVDLVADTGFTVADGVTGTGEITRNGTVLKAAFGETPVGSFSGTVNLTNTGSNAAPFTTSCLTTTGRVAGNAGSVAANSASRFGIGSANGLNCPSNTRGLELTFAVPTGNVIGSVVRQDASTGQAAFDGMTGNQ
jgi:hypothetical protein